MVQVVTPLWMERETQMTQIGERSTDRISVESFQLFQLPKKKKDKKKIRLWMSEEGK